MSEFTTVPLQSLHFDLQNPRLPTSVANTTEHDVLTYLARNTALENLMASIGENDFFPGEALVVVKSGRDVYTVIEGNRRLAALRLLQDSSLLSLPKITRVAQEAHNRPTQIPVFIAPSRDDTLQYLGFRHISGVQRWDPLAKARYLQQLFGKTSGEPNERYTAVAREIGSNRQTVRRNLDALAAYQIVSKAEFYDIPDLSDATFQFGTFYTAIGNHDIASFIGIRKDDTPQHPIVDSSVVNTTCLQELIDYMFRSDAKGDTKLIESRNIGKLGTVLTTSTCLEGLRSGMSLEAAYRLGPHGRETFERHMQQAIEELKQANANLHTVEKTDDAAVRAVAEAKKALSIAVDHLGV